MLASVAVVPLSDNFTMLGCPFTKETEVKSLQSPHMQGLQKYL
jgi:hypothetical protein